MIVRIKRVMLALPALILMLVPIALPRVATASAIVNQYPLINGGNSAVSITSGPDGALWVGVYGASCSGCSATSYVYRVATSGSMTSYQVTDGSGTYNSSYDQPNGITTGPDGNLWFTLGDSGPYGFIGKLTTSGSVSRYLINPFANPGPFGITTGPDGNLWFASFHGASVSSISTSGAFGSAYTLPSGALFPRNITTGPDGDLWFTVGSQNDIYSMTTSGVTTAYPISSAAGDITVGPDGALWFTEYSSNKIGRITTSGSLTEYSIPTAASNPFSITSGPDGALWFTENVANQIGRITTSGTITEYTLPTSATNPGKITTGSDGDLWFTDNNGIGQLNPVISIPAAPVLTASSPAQNPYLSWNAVPGADSYNIYRNSSLIDSITTSNVTSYTDFNAPEGTSTYHVTAVNTAGESSPSNSVNVLVDRTAPTLGTPTWSTNPLLVNTTDSTLTIPATDSGSGVVGGEYYIGGTDPGVGNATPMTYSSGNLTASLGSSLPAGVYTISYRAEDAVGNWSTVTPSTQTMLVIFDSTTTLGMTGKDKKNELVPSTTNGDVMPGLTSTSTDGADYGFTVQYKSGVLDTHNGFTFKYATGSHTFSLTATSFDWMTTGGTNNSQGWFQGIAHVTVDGVTTSNPFWVTGTDGNRMTPTSSNYLQLKVYAPGANPSTATPIYQASGTMTSRSSVKIQ